MKKFLSIFLVGQLIIIMHFFNMSIYPMINSQTMLKDYSSYNYKLKTSEEYAQTDLSDYPDIQASTYTYDYPKIIYDALSTSSKKIIIMNTEYNEHNKKDIHIYHNADVVFNSKYISSNYRVIYHDLDYNYFYEHFTSSSLYTDADLDFLNNIDPHIKFEKNSKLYNLICSYNFYISYLPILFLLCIFNILAILIYAILNKKEHAIKTTLGFSKYKAALYELKDFIKIHIFSNIFSIVLFSIYYTVYHSINIWFILLCLLISVIVTVINSILLFISQIVFININIPQNIKHAVYSKKFFYFLKTASVLVIIILSYALYALSTLGFFATYNEEKERKETHNFLASYTYVSDLGNNFRNICKDKDTMQLALTDTKKLYIDLTNNGYLMYFHSDTLDLLNESLRYAVSTSNSNIESIEYFPDNKESKRYQYNFRNNYVVVNENYAKNFINVSDLSGNKIAFDTKSNIPYVLVPEEYKNHEESLKNTYKNMLKENYYNYNNPSAIPSYTTLYENCAYEGTSNQCDIDSLLDQVTFIYISDYTMDNIICDVSYDIRSLYNPIIVVANGNDFDTDFYLNNLIYPNVFFLSKNISDTELTSIFNKYDFANDVYFSTFISPLAISFSSSSYHIEILYLLFILLILTAVFLTFITAYINYQIKHKELATKHILGYSMFKSIKAELLLDMLIFIILPIFISLIISLNFDVFLIFMLLDIICTIIMYKFCILKNLYKFTKN